MVDKIGCERFDCWAGAIRTPSPITQQETVIKKVELKDREQN